MALHLGKVLWELHPNRRGVALKHAEGRPTLLTHYIFLFAYIQETHQNLENPMVRERNHNEPGKNPSPGPERGTAMDLESNRRALQVGPKHVNFAYSRAFLYFFTIIFLTEKFRVLRNVLGRYPLRVLEVPAACFRCIRSVLQ